ncbi:hypothetical protein [Arthrobacter sp. TMS2-4]
MPDTSHSNPSAGRIDEGLIPDGSCGFHPNGLIPIFNTGHIHAALFFVESMMTG